MEQESHTKEFQVKSTHHRVPNKVTDGDCTDKPTIRSVAEDRKISIISTALDMWMGPCRHYDGNGNETLHHGHHMDVEVQFRLGIETGVGVAKEFSADNRGQRLDAKVKQH